MKFNLRIEDEEIYNYTIEQGVSSSPQSISQSIAQSVKKVKIKLDLYRFLVVYLGMEKRKKIMNLKNKKWTLDVGSKVIIVEKLKRTPGWIVKMNKKSAIVNMRDTSYLDPRGSNYIFPFSMIKIA